MCADAGNVDALARTFTAWHASSGHIRRANVEKKAPIDALMPTSAAA
jgi:hypothetical protein